MLGQNFMNSIGGILLSDLHFASPIVNNDAPIMRASRQMYLVPPIALFFVLELGFLSHRLWFTERSHVNGI